MTYCEYDRANLIRIPNSVFALQLHKLIHTRQAKNFIRL